MITKINKRGFTLLEMLIVMALIAILAGIVIASLNPARQFALGRNSTRRAHITTIMNAISANISENGGVFTCATGTLPSSPTNMSTSSGDYDIAPCLVPDYISSMPYDPSATDTHWTDVTDYDTAYEVSMDADDIITITAAQAELDETISITR